MSQLCPKFPSAGGFNDLQDGPISHSWVTDIVFVNFDPDVIDTSLVRVGLPTERDYTTTIAWIHYDIEYRFHFANQSYAERLRDVMLANSITGDDIGSALNETALEYQKAHPDEPQRIFYPRAGRAIDGDAVEDWLLENPAVTPPAMGYVLYVFNFSEFDSPDHSFEHWYDYHPVDPDSGRTQDFFRLEWDNELNTGVKFDSAGFGGRGNIYVIDPTADQWYLRWARVWWGEAPYDDDPQYTFYDMDELVSTLNLTQQDDRIVLNSYLQEYIYDPVTYLFFPGQHIPTSYAESGRVKCLVFCMDVAAGVSVESLEWVTSADLQLAHLNELIPFIDWDVSVEYLDIDDYPAWKNLFWQFAWVDDGTTYVDGAGLFNAIYQTMRPNYISELYDVNVFSVVFIKKKMVMVYGNRTFTGLGGGGQTVIWKSWERYYLPDGVTPKAGVSAIQLHETMHAIGFGHSWSVHHYAADFYYGPMGYYSFHNGTSSFEQNWAQGTYTDQMYVSVASDLSEEVASIGDNPRPETATARDRAEELLLQALGQLNRMDWKGAYSTLLKAKHWIRRLYFSKVDTAPPVIEDIVVNISNLYDGAEIDVSTHDDFSGVYSVQAVIDIDGTGSTIDLSFNGTLWTGLLPAVPTTAHLVTLAVYVQDWGLNTASTTLTLLSVTETGGPSPLPLLPVAAAAGTIALVAVLVVVMRKRRHPSS